MNPKSGLPYHFTGPFAGFRVIPLLHEMVHISTFSFAFWERCCGNWHSVEASCGGIGTCDHGSPFLDSLSVITDSLIRVVVWPVDPLIEMSTRISTCVDDWQPEITQLERWALENDDLE